MRQHGVNTKGILRPIRRHVVVRMAALFVLFGCIGGMLIAGTYFYAAVPRLYAAAPTMGSFDHNKAEVWWVEDADRLESLADRWPFSIPTIIGEVVLLWTEQHNILRAGVQPSERGYTIVPPGPAGQLHLLTVSIQGRLRALTHGWSRSASDFDQRHYQGYPLSGLQGIAVQPEEVHDVLGTLPVPDSVFSGYKIILLPFVLQDTAGLGSRGQAVIGAAPLTTDAVNPNRTIYTMLHELGHHIHFKYMDHAHRNSAELWNEYMQLRDIEEWTPSGAVGTETWARSAQETFAEDFRILFGPAAAHSIPHGTDYGDPNVNSDPEAVHAFISKLISM